MKTSTPLEDAVAFDNCGDVTISTSTDTALFDCQYVVTRTFVATDACENVTTDTQTITVEFLPTIEFVTFPEDYTAECDAFHPLDMPEVNETCSAVTITEVTDTVGRLVRARIHRDPDIHRCRQLWQFVGPTHPNHHHCRHHRACA